MHAVEVGCRVARLIGLTREPIPCTGGGLVASLKQIRVLYTGHTGMHSSPHTHTHTHTKPTQVDSLTSILSANKKRKRKKK